MNTTSQANRPHIAFFGRINTGKSSLINAVTGQKTSLVSDVKGTTTDPVYKAMEILPLGPVVLIDTPGMDDDSELGEMRVKLARRVLTKADIAVLVADAVQGLGESDNELIALFQEREIPYLIAFNKSDLSDNQQASPPGEKEMFVSAKTGAGIEALKERIAALGLTDEVKPKLIADMLSPGDFVVLVVPIDSSAPKDRLILPQAQTIRDVLEAEAASVVVREFELANTLARLGQKPRIVITDSQAFAKVSADTPLDVPLTSFSILFARFKGFLKQAVAGAKALDSLKDGSRILISEGCTHHRQCEDIGTVKLPHWLRQYSGKNLEFAFSSGTEFPEALNAYDLIIHCGGCMQNEREIRHRARAAGAAGVPMTNYGISIAQMQGILKRCTEMFIE